MNVVHPPLEDLLAELQTDTQSAISEHLAECPECQQKWDRAAMGGASWLLETASQVQLPTPPELIENLATQFAFNKFETVAQLETLPDTTLDRLLPTSGDRQRIGPYEVLGVVGRGGMGIVLQGFDVVLQRTVALKIPTLTMRTDPVARGRFLREGRAAAAINHQNIVPILAVEEYAGVPVLVMPFVQGESLQQRLDREKKLPPAEALRIALQTAQALTAAHERGIVHRDVKPANILLESTTDTVRLTDFGLARASDDCRLTQTGLGAGTPLFMSPEQASGTAIDHRSDLFSLGSVLFTMLAGEAPFAAESLMGTLCKLRDGKPQSLRSHVPNLPLHLEELVMSLLKTNPDHRPSTASQVGLALEQSLKFVLEGIDPPRQRRRKLWLGLAVFLCFVGLTTAAGTVLKFPTPTGTLVIEIDDPETKVLYDQDGREVTITGVGLQEVKLKLGQMPVRIVGPGGSTQEIVNIIKGEKTVLKAKYIPNAVPQVGSGGPGGLPGTDAPTGSGLPGSGRPITGFIPRSDAPGLSGLGEAVNSVRPKATPKAFPPVPEVPLDPKAPFFATPGVPQRALVVSPDGHYLMTASTWPVADGLIRVWDTQTRQVKHTMTGSKGDIPVMILSPDGKQLVSASEDGIIRIWDYENNKEVRTIKASTGLIIALAFSPDGKMLASAGDGPEILINNFLTGNVIQTIKVYPRPPVRTGLGFPGMGGGADGLAVPRWSRIRTLAFSPDGQSLVSGGEDESAVIWDVATAKAKVHMMLGNGWVEKVAFLSPTQVVVANRMLQVFDLETGSLKGSVQANKYGITELRIAPSGRTFVTSGSDGKVIVWQIDLGKGGEIIKPVLSLTACDGNANQVAFGKAGQLFVSCGGRYDNAKQKFDAVDLGIRMLQLKPIAMDGGGGGVDIGSPARP